MSVVKIDDDEKQKVVELKNTFSKIQNEMGAVEFRKIMLEESRKGLDDFADKLKTDYEDTRKQEQQVLQELNTKYGDGSLNIETGELTLSAK